MLGLVAFAACGGEDAPAPAPTLEVAATATAMPEPTATPPYLTSSIDILKVGMTTSAHESMLPYELPTPRSHIHAVYEAFVGLSEVDGAMIPRLATDWSMSADGTQWIFDVRKGVEFHFGYGEMTSADLRHTWERDTSDEAINADHLTWQGVIATAEDIDISDPYKVIFNMSRPEPDLLYSAAGRNSAMTLMQSKAQWDDVGGDTDAIRARPAGTGSWSLNTHKGGESFLFDRVENHWRQTPAFKQMAFIYSPEEATRLAMLVTGEVHMADLSRQLQESALAVGMARVTAFIPGSGINYLFGGNWHSSDPDDKANIDPNNPLTKRNVRKAIAHAIDRQSIVSNIFDDRGPVNVSESMHPAISGGAWDDTWEERTKTEYNYDPEKAKALLAEAGYPNGFDMVLKSHNWTGTPEMTLMDEAVAQYLVAVGINVELESVEYGRTREGLRNRQSSGWMYAMPPWNLGPPHLSLRCCYVTAPRGYLFFYTNDELNSILDKLDASLDLAERDDLQKQFGNLVFDEYMNLPIIQFNLEIAVDPGVIQYWPATGGFTDAFTHTEYIVPAV